MSGSYIVIEQGAPRVAQELPCFHPNRLGVLNRFWEHVHAFDETSRYRLAVSEVPSYGLLSRILARTIYAPVVDLRSAWVKCGEYDRTAFVALVKAGLDHDDDIIQQWFEAKDVIRLLNAARSFREMVLAIQCICGAHETDAEAERFVERALSNSR